MISCTKYIDDAVRVEQINAEAGYGRYYNSNHEGFAVLLEEVEEAHDELERVTRCKDALWDMIKSPLSADESREGVNECLKMAEIAAMHLAAEAAQVAAVCRKFQNSVICKAN